MLVIRCQVVIGQVSAEADISPEVMLGQSQLDFAINDRFDGGEKNTSAGDVKPSLSEQIEEGHVDCNETFHWSEECVICFNGVQVVVGIECCCFLMLNDVNQECCV